MAQTKGRKGQQTERVVINVTPEQLAAVDEALAIAKVKATKSSQNDILLVALVMFCDSAGVEFPIHEKHQGKRNDLKRTP